VVAGCIAYHHAYCAWADRCDQYLYGGSLEACQSTAESQCSWYELPGIAITGADFTRCAESFDAGRCDATPTCELPPGTRENGFPCASLSQCESGYCAPGSGGCGICGPNPRQPAGGACANSLDCDAQLDCVELVCTPKRREGELCDDVHHCETVQELGFLLCLGACTLVGLPGERCPPGGSCGSGTACTTENVCVVTERAEEGDVCGTFADRVAACWDGACVADPNDPSVTRCVSWGKGGESCNKVPNIERCATGLVCTNAICAWPEALLPADCG
jgi:hypothetical protein